MSISFSINSWFFSSSSIAFCFFSRVFASFFQQQFKISYLFSFGRIYSDQSSPNYSTFEKSYYGNIYFFVLVSILTSQAYLIIYMSKGSTLTGIFLVPNNPLHVCRALTCGDTKMRSTLIFYKALERFQHCDKPLQLKGLSINFVLYVSRLLNSWCDIRYPQSPYKFNSYAIFSVWLFHCDSACLIRIISVSQFFDFYGIIVSRNLYIFKRLPQIQVFKINTNSDHWTFDSSSKLSKQGLQFYIYSQPNRLLSSSNYLALINQIVKQWDTIAMTGNYFFNSFNFYFSFATLSLRFVDGSVIYLFFKSYSITSCLLSTLSASLFSYFLQANYLNYFGSIYKDQLSPKSTTLEKSQSGNIYFFLLVSILTSQPYPIFYINKGSALTGICLPPNKPLQVCSALI